MRIQVNLSEEIISRLDKQAKDIGITRSSYCAVILGQAVVGYDMAVNSLDKSINETFKKVKSATTKR